jgi:hypothetical protein
LLRGFDGGEIHGRPLHRLRIAIIVFVSLEERLHLLRRQEANVMPQCFDLPGDVMQPAFQDRLGQFLNEKRHAIGVCNDLIAHFGRKGLALADAVNKCLSRFM